ncbi:MAG: outer membrane lipoprotein chaperone LolA [Wenzhouxiangellaceae bacterium]
MRAFSEGLQTLSADFLQTSLDLDGNPEQSSGHMLVKHPDRLRWNYLKPYSQKIIADGERVWTYDVDLAQVTVRPQSEALSNTALSALTDSGRLERYFILHDGGAHDELEWVVLTPRATAAGEQSAEFEEIRLGLRGDRLQRMTIADRLGQNTDIVFSQLQRNLEVQDAEFEFEPPPGVDVFEDDPFSGG